MRVSFDDVDHTNRIIANGQFVVMLKDFVETFKPECCYCFEANGVRSLTMVVNNKDNLLTANYAEPFFQGFKANVVFHPCFGLEDYEAQGAAIGASIKKYSENGKK